MFIINPVAELVKGNIEEIVTSIHGLFKLYSDMQFDIYVTKFSRDAVSYIRKYMADARDIVRVYAVGGSGTLNEVVNGCMHMPNVQIAYYPRGRLNSFINCFGEKNVHLFSSLRNLVMADTIYLDAFSCGNKYGIANCLIGAEASAKYHGDKISEKTGIASDIGFKVAGIHCALSGGFPQEAMNVVIDGENYSGRYFSMNIANIATYGRKMVPAVEARPDDGRLEIYMIALRNRYKVIPVAYHYTRGSYDSVSDKVNHIQARKIDITSKSPFCYSLDGEVYFDRKLSCEIVPGAVNFVCPAGLIPAPGGIFAGAVRR